MNYKHLLNKVDKEIRKKGIPYYVKKWKPYKMPKNYKDDDDFLQNLTKYVKSYHNHSFVMYKCKCIQPKDCATVIKCKQKYIEDRKMPDFFFSNNNKIGKIVFYQFCWSPKPVCRKDSQKLVKLIKAQLKQWQTDGMKGLILDFRHHYGGSIYPLFDAFSDMFNGSTIFAWSNKKVKKSDKTWLNMKDGKLVMGKFLSKTLNFDKPIAVLIGPSTTSSGEFGAAMFYGRSNVKFFGQPTSGYASSNDMIKINNDLNLILTTCLVTTVDGLIHVKEKIYPDHKTDKPITEAKKWINKTGK